MLPTKSIRWGTLPALVALSLALAACQGGSLPVSPALLQQIARSSQTAATAAAESTAAPTAAPEAQTTALPADAPAAAIAAAEGAVPVALTIPAINLGAEVTPMGWELTMNGEQITTRWVVPLDTLGWAVNSAGAGAAGNMVIVGHQALGAALLRPLALEEVTPGQEIRVQGADGVTYLYLVSEVSPPLPAIGATADDLARAAAYLAPTTDTRLTLVSGWPADTTTHRLFVVAEYTGVAP
jgi:hypothetical protein